MGWLLILLLGAAALGLLWRFARPDTAGLQLLAAALLLAFAGYAWQGNPGLHGSPRRAAERPGVPETAFSAMRRDVFGQFDAADTWLTLSEAMLRSGDTAGAAGAIRAGLKARPTNAILWTGYGNALALHAGGLLSPGADLAFRRAIGLAPRHPGPLLFYGIALAQNGRLPEAERAWRRALALAPPNASWREPLEQQLALIASAPPEPAPLGP
jgi:cytochrome c-type biogenesis protein CcmH/NrfG